MSAGRLLVVLACASCAASCAPGRLDRSVRQDVLLARDVDTFEFRVPPNATLAGLLKSHEASSSLADEIVGAVRDQFDPRRLRANQPYSLITSLTGAFREFRYAMSADQFLRVALRDPDTPDDPQFDVEIVEYPKEVVVDAVQAEITREHPSLLAALDDRGENIQLALLLADAFSGEVDFNSDLQPGDHFEVLFDRVYRDGEFAGYEQIRAATLYNDGRQLTAIRFAGPDGRDGWYDVDGRSLKRQFLKSPLKFDPHITSRFSTARLHPVLNIVRAHKGVDYRAPYGAPVVAVSNGTVVEAGFAGGAGRRVVIRHASGYSTAYFHLSAIAAGIRPGVRVSQGDQIGRVGNSGTVTATHLHYELRRGGLAVNPVTALRSMPPGEPIPADMMPAFLAERDTLLGALTSTLSPSDVPATSRGQ